MARKLKRSKGKGKSNATNIKTEKALTILRQVYLGGIIDECTLTIKKGKGYVEAVDITNSLIVIAHNNIADKTVSCELGLGNLELLISFFSSIDDNKIQLKYKDGEDYCTFKRQDKRRKLVYLLTQPDMIATNLSLEEEEEEEEEEEAYEKFSKLMEYSVELTPTLIKDLLRYITMLSVKEVVLIYDGDATVTFRLGSSDDHQFELALSEEVVAEAKDTEEMEIAINGEHLAKVFSTLNYDEEDPPSLNFGSAETPIMIEYTGICWCLDPLTDFEEEE